MVKDSDWPTLPKRGMPLTILTGFLGSGKTTVLNHILSHANDLKIAVLVNEFGDINIDSQLLIQGNEDGIVELSNGCICCTINENLVDAVYRVLERDDRVDYIVIETTGVADPLPIILSFLGTELRDLIQVDSILTVVDAEAFTPEHFESEAALKQIIYGDMILLNKTDLVPQDKLEELEKYIKGVKPVARILHTQYGQVALPLIIDARLHQIDAWEDEYHDHDHDHHSHHDHDHHKHSHHLENDGFVSVSFESDRPFDLTKFEAFLSDELPSEVFRAKGILWFSESELRHIFQLSGPRYNINAEEWQTSPKNQIVLIGRKLNADTVCQKLSDCLV